MTKEELISRIRDGLAPLAPRRILLFGSAAKALDQFYIPTRYPSGLPSGIPSGHFTPRQAQEALSAAERIIRLAKDRLGVPPRLVSRSGPSGRSSGSRRRYLP